MRYEGNEKLSLDRLRTRKRPFAYTQTTVRAYAKATDRFFNGKPIGTVSTENIVLSDYELASGIALTLDIDAGGRAMGDLPATEIKVGGRL